jgi:hypothetical protein
MVSPFETVILRLKDLGAFQFLFPFMLTAAVFYGLLRKSQIFGPPERNVAVNAIVALIAAFMVFSYPILSGVNIETQLSAFFFQGLVGFLVVAMGILISGLFLPENVGKIVGEKLGGKTIGVLAIAIFFGGIGILFTSGLSSIFFPQGVSVEIPQDMLIGIFALVLLIGLVAAIVMPGKK